MRLWRALLRRTSAYAAEASSRPQPDCADSDVRVTPAVRASRTSPSCCVSLESPGGVRSSDCSLEQGDSGETGNPDGESNAACCATDANDGHYAVEVRQGQYRWPLPTVSLGRAASGGSGSVDALTVSLTCLEEDRLAKRPVGVRFLLGSRASCLQQRRRRWVRLGPVGGYFPPRGSLIPRRSNAQHRQQDGRSRAVRPRGESK